MSLKDKIKKDSEVVGINQGSDMFQFSKSGDYRFRILTEPEAIATHFFGKGVASSVCYGIEKGCPFHVEHENASLKYIVYLIDRADGKVKLGELPYSVISAVSDFEEDEDYKFDSYPMPYDIKVKCDKENKDPKQIYKTFAAPNRSELTVEEVEGLSDKLNKITPVDFVQKRKDKAIQTHKESGLWQKEQDRKAKLKEDLDKVRGSAADQGYDYPESDGEEIPF